MKSDVFIIIVTYNGIKWIDKCLSSCKGYQIIVIDNLSTDNTVSFIKSNFPDVVILSQNENLGFGQANNIGMSYALNHGADAVFLLNQDAYIKEGTIEKLVDSYKENQDYGILSPIHLNWEGTLIEYYFYKFSSYNRDFFSSYVLNNELNQIYDVSFINAAAWFVPKQALLTVGGFDPLFFHYGEDNNYCQRLKYHKFKIGIVPEAYIYHDSIIREKPKNHLFSKEFYKKELSHFLSKYANINMNFSNKELWQINKNMIYLILLNIIRLKFKKANVQIKKYKMFIPFFSKIKNSRAQNVKEGSHYIDL